jgi:hypothetical protein
MENGEKLIRLTSNLTAADVILVVVKKNYKPKSKRRE